MNTVTVKERGWPGHFIGAAYCRFRRNTLITVDGEPLVVVSTIGAYFPPSRKCIETIGHMRHFETRAFCPDPKDKVYFDADVETSVGFASPWSLYITADTEPQMDNLANDMHDTVVAELVRTFEGD